MNDIITSEDRGIPVLTGDQYCSASCGFGCTRAAYQRATEEADSLAKRLGGGWRPYVWESCGWHYVVKCGICDISPVLGGKQNCLSGDWDVVGYRAWIQTKPQFISESGKTPEEAFRNALDKIQAVFDQLQGSLRMIRDDPMIAPLLAQPVRRRSDA